MSVPEASYYQDGNVQVTNARAVFGAKTYAMSNITSVTMGVISANRTAGVVVAILGLLIAACGGGSGNQGGGILLFGIVILIVGIALAIMQKDKYAVRIGSASGETDGLLADDQAYIQKIVNAVNEAIIKRG